MREDTQLYTAAVFKVDFWLHAV